MSISRTQARDEALGALKAAVDAYNSANGTSVQVVYDDNEADAPDATVAWVRARLRHTATTKLTLGPTGQRLATRDGVMVASLRTPFGDGLAFADSLSRAIMLALEGHVGGVSFVRVSANEAGKYGPWAETNVAAPFYYLETTS